MAFSKHVIGLGLRLLLLAAFALLCSVLALWGYWFTALVAGLLWLGFCVQLYQFLHKSARDFARMLDAIAYDDYSLRLLPPQDQGQLQHLYQEMNAVLDKFRELRARESAQQLFLDQLLQHLPVGILVLEEGGKVRLANPEALRILDLPVLLHLRELERHWPELARIALDEAALTEKILDWAPRSQTLQLSVSLLRLSIRDQRLRVLSLQNVSGEMARREWLAWQNLLRVLAHEMMNSLTPITSLAGYLNEAMAETPEPAPEVCQDWQAATATIQRRSQGLLRFVQSYRAMARLPEPHYQVLNLEELLLQLQTLYLAECQQYGIALTLELRIPRLSLHTDPELLTQALVNLLKNAVEAVQGRPQPQIKLSLGLDEQGGAEIRVQDNGPGIAPERVPDLFIPFYTTKPQGTGIGLSVSRQLLQLLGGQLQYEAVLPTGACFVLRLPGSRGASVS